ncbi:DUF4433 domain-containing protein [Agromyces protaetiae]|uniref:DUF4433 domain-containing protein n=1 Tax=Agromyces protaetiae TaxID=2509455 RepID=A0A4P6FJ33_9MICO|nr:DarT ssDNA thymidine ADP-ribosyltransferase family protein [Agromyces protaetiae]QAY74599.1 DUF4433 domain-containing protein [Agromyces protaetiae]
MGECIHGFDEGLCAICFPPKEPEPRVAPARPVRQPAARSSLRTPAATTPRAASTRAAGAKSSKLQGAAPVDAGALRVYHLTHVDNLARILGAGAILADVGDEPATPVVDIAAPAVREYRRTAPLGETGEPIAAYVPFFLSTDAHLWTSIRDGEPDPRIAVPEGGARPAADFVLLVSSVAQAGGAQSAVDGHIVVADADPALPSAEIIVGRHDAERMLRKLAFFDEGTGLESGEFLVRGSVPLERVTIIAVANDRVRDRVRQALAAVGAKTRVSVYPPWFLPTAG